VHLVQAILFVNDLSAMVAFYGDLLGLSVLKDTSVDGFVRFDAGGTVLALHTIRHKGSPAPREAVHLKLCFHSDNVDADRARLIAAGVEMRGIQRFGSVALCDGLDPEGNVFQITTR
jgi:catechol 2,3-dioxygenase-like lactoylglutathione lyase family enzyme